MRPARSTSVGLLVAAALVAATTGAIYGVREAVPVVATGVLYLIAVLIVSSYWGLWLGLATSVASAAAFNFFHIPPTGRWTIAESENWLALGAYFVAAVFVSTLANAARARAVEAKERRREADLAAELARLLLGAGELSAAVGPAGARIAESLGLDDVEVRLRASPIGESSSSPASPGACSRSGPAAALVSLNSPRPSPSSWRSSLSLTFAAWPRRLRPRRAFRSP
jgi:two-component system, OmpR family, sensor histidine kinase KdpD